MYIPSHFPKPKWMEESEKAKEGPKKEESKTSKQPTKKKKFTATGDFFADAKSELAAYGIASAALEDVGKSEDHKHATEATLNAVRAMSQILDKGMLTKKLSLLIGKIDQGSGTKKIANYSPTKYGKYITIDSEKGKNSFFHEYAHYLDDAIHEFKRFGISGYKIETVGPTKLKDVLDAIRETKSYKDVYKEQEKIKDKKYAEYLRSEHEEFARFFSQWTIHKAKKLGISLPNGLDDKNEDKSAYKASFANSELDSIGEKMEHVLRKANLMKNFFSTLLELEKMGE